MAEEEIQETETEKDPMLMVFGQSTDDLVYKSAQVLIKFVSLKNDTERRVFVDELKFTSNPENYPPSGFANIVFLLCRKFCSIALRTIVPYSKHQQNVAPNEILLDFNKFWKLLNIDDLSGEVTPVINVIRTFIYSEQFISSGSKEASEHIIDKLTKLSTILTNIEILNSALISIKHPNVIPPPSFDELTKKGFDLNLPATEVFGAVLRSIV